MKTLFKMATVASFTLAALSVQAASAGPAVVYDSAGKFDKSFNEAVFRTGVEVYNKDKGVTVKEFEPQNEAQREQGLRRLASRGYGPIVAVGFNFASAVEKVAGEFPDSQFTIIDMVVDKPNVQSIVFKEHEGSFLVGALAALKSQSGKVGFVGGMDIPLIRKFECGYEQGAKYINPKIEVLQNMTGSTPPPSPIRPRGPSWPSPSSLPVWTSSMPPPAAPVSVFIRPPRTKVSWPSGLTPTRTTCSRVPC